MSLPILKDEKLNGFDGQHFHDCYASAIAAAEDMQESFNAGKIEKAIWWAQRAQYWWCRVREEIEKLEGV